MIKTSRKIQGSQEDEDDFFLDFLPSLRCIPFRKLLASLLAFSLEAEVEEELRFFDLPQTRNSTARAARTHGAAGHLPPRHQLLRFLPCGSFGKSRTRLCQLSTLCGDDPKQMRDCAGARFWRGKKGGKAQHRVGTRRWAKNLHT